MLRRGAVKEAPESGWIWARATLTDLSRIFGTRRPPGGTSRPPILTPHRPGGAPGGGTAGAAEKGCCQHGTATDHRRAPGIPHGEGQRETPRYLTPNVTRSQQRRAQKPPPTRTTTADLSSNNPDALDPLSRAPKHASRAAIGPINKRQATEGGKDNPEQKDTVQAPDTHMRTPPWRCSQARTPQAHGTDTSCRQPQHHHAHTHQQGGPARDGFTARRSTWVPPAQASHLAHAGTKGLGPSPARRHGPTTTHPAHPQHIDTHSHRVPGPPDTASRTESEAAGARGGLPPCSPPCLQDRITRTQASEPHQTRHTHSDTPPAMDATSRHTLSLAGDARAGHFERGARRAQGPKTSYPAGQPEGCPAWCQVPAPLN